MPHVRLGLWALDHIGLFFNSVQDLNDLGVNRFLEFGLLFDDAHIRVELVMKRWLRPKHKGPAVPGLAFLGTDKSQ